MHTPIVYGCDRNFSNQETPMAHVTGFSGVSKIIDATHLSRMGYLLNYQRGKNGYETMGKMLAISAVKNGKAPGKVAIPFNIDIKGGHFKFENVRPTVQMGIANEFGASEPELDDQTRRLRSVAKYLQRKDFSPRGIINRKFLDFQGATAARSKTEESRRPKSPDFDNEGWANLPGGDCKNLDHLIKSRYKKFAGIKPRAPKTKFTAPKLPKGKVGLIAADLHNKNSFTIKSTLPTGYDELIKLENYKDSRRTGSFEGWDSKLSKRNFIDSGLNESMLGHLGAIELSIVPCLKGVSTNFDINNFINEKGCKNPGSG
jgi:hypothetical protein